jgi:hypothetical protein
VCVSLYVCNEYMCLLLLFVSQYIIA